MDLTPTSADYPLRRGEHAAASTMGVDYGTTALTVEVAGERGQKTPSVGVNEGRLWRMPAWLEILREDLCWSVYRVTVLPRSESAYNPARLCC